MEPGAVLRVFLSQIDVDRVTGFDRVRVLQAHARMAAHYQAHVYADTASVTGFMRDLEGDINQGAHAAAAEIRVALKLTRRATENELAMALDRRERLANVWRMLAAGGIDMRRARCIAHGTAHLSMATARQTADRILADAPDLTTGQIVTRLRRLCVEADPEEAEDRYGRALADRSVVVEATPEGTANLYATNLPPDRLSAIKRRIHDMAQALRGNGEIRTMDQRRSDVLLDLLEGARQTGSDPRAVVDLCVDLGTLVGLNDAPGEIAGFGPVIADIARQVVERQQDAEWRFTVTDGATGLVIDNGITSRRPTTEQRRHAQARRRSCVFPGCRMPALRSDFDHRIPSSEGGPTKTTHLAPLCRHDHCVCHRFGWTLAYLPTDASSGGPDWDTPTSRGGLRPRTDIAQPSTQAAE